MLPEAAGAESIGGEEGRWAGDLEFDYFKALSMRNYLLLRIN